MPAEVSEKVTLHGSIRQRPQLIEHYYAGDIFVLPSICNDSFGIPVVEAMAAGLRVAVSDIGGPRELVKTSLMGRVLPDR